MKETIIESKEDFKKFSDNVFAYFKACDGNDIKFQPFRLISKKISKNKSQRQHRFYWALIGELKKAMFEQGILMNQEEIHELIKTEAKFTKTVEINNKTFMVTCSIADNSDDIDSKNMIMLCDFVKQFALENLNYTISEQYAL